MFFYNYTSYFFCNSTELVRFIKIRQYKCSNLKSTIQSNNNQHMSTGITQDLRSYEITLQIIALLTLNIANIAYRITPHQTLFTKPNCIESHYIKHYSLNQIAYNHIAMLFTKSNSLNQIAYNHIAYNQIAYKHIYCNHTQ